MNTNIRYWQSVLQDAERELEAATGNITLSAPAKELMQAASFSRRSAVAIASGRLAP